MPEGVEVVGMSVLHPLHIGCNECKIVILFMMLAFARVVQVQIQDWHFIREI
jgi:hypothetical protein